ncbi:MAG: DUF86 domain-containing protein [Gaiellales bacterium]|nr:MAG: DUF86 domain-containing protein [Gaiellales bacterium]
MINPEKLASMLENLSAYLDILRDYAAVPGDEFLADRKALDGAKYNFIVAIECCIDIGSHVIASEGMRVPSDYRDVAEVLEESGIIGKDLAEKFKLMISFRNRLVHMYWKVDDELVREYLENNLVDIGDLAKSYARLIQG